MRVTIPGEAVRLCTATKSNTDDPAQGNGGGMISSASEALNDKKVINPAEDKQQKRATEDASIGELSCLTSTYRSNEEASKLMGYLAELVKSICATGDPEEMGDVRELLAYLGHFKLSNKRSAYGVAWVGPLRALTEDSKQSIKPGNAAATSADNANAAKVRAMNRFLAKKAKDRRSSQGRVYEPSPTERQSIRDKPDVEISLWEQLDALLGVPIP